MRLVRILAITKAQPQASDAKAYIDGVRSLLAKRGASPAAQPAYDIPIKVLVGEPPADPQLTEMANEAFGNGIWNQSAYRVEFGDIDDAALGSGRLLLVYEGDDAHGVATQCPTCGKTLRIDLDSNRTGYRCSGLGCRRVYCGDHMPSGAKCDCGGRMQMSKISYATPGDAPSAPRVERVQLTGSEVVVEKPGTVKVMIPGGFYALEMATEREARDAAKALRSLIRRESPSVFAVPGGVSTKSIESLKPLLERSGFVEKARRVYVTAVETSASGTVAASTDASCGRRKKRWQFWS